MRRLSLACVLLCGLAIGCSEQEMAEEIPFDGGSGQVGDAGGASGLPCDIDHLL